MNSGLYTISEISNIMAPIAEDFGVKKVALFGSYARGEATENSDLDFHIIDRGSLRGLFRLSGFALTLEDAFKKPVEVVTTNSMFDDVKAIVEQEEQVIYEA